MLDSFFGLALVAICPVMSVNTSDTDGDGLSDFQETHKYLTDPSRADTDGDGDPDGEWLERQEYSYTLRTILRYLPPFDDSILNDDYQDARLLENRDDYIEVEVIHYPFSTAEQDIDANPNWRHDCANMKHGLEQGITTNWDDGMRHDVLAELNKSGIDVGKLTDKQIVEQVSTWAMRRSRSLDNVFTTYYVYFPNGTPTVLPGLEQAYRKEFERDRISYDWNIDQHFEHELLGRGMYYHKTHGSCTSTAIYLATVLRAVGVPTRMILAIPAVDPGCRDQMIWSLGMSPTTGSATSCWTG